MIVERNVRNVGVTGSPNNEMMVERNVGVVGGLIVDLLRVFLGTNFK